jgi:hypothetical protein
VAKLKSKSHEHLTDAGVDSASIPMFVVAAQNSGDLARGTPREDVEGPLLESEMLVQHTVNVARRRRAQCD